MRLLRYTLLTIFLPTFSYAVYWTQFEDNLTSPVSWIFIIVLGIVLCEIVIYILLFRTSDIKKLGIGGQEQTTVEH